MKKAFGFGLAIVMPFLMASAFLTSHARGTEAASVVERPRPQPPWSSPATSSIGGDDDDADVDLLGNPVSDAVAKYKFDDAGSLYEVHSPQTELPRLAPPKS